MGKKKSASKKLKGSVRELPNGKCKTKCCKKYKKGENKRCKRCPCYDLFKKVAYSPPDYFDLTKLKDGLSSNNLISVGTSR